jgi:hypothetical protein
VAWSDLGSRHLNERTRWVTLKEELSIPMPVSVGMAGNRWACQIEGEAEDIADLTAALNTGPAMTEYCVASIASVPALTCALWNPINDVLQVKALADAAIKECVACINMVNVCGEMKIGTLYEFKADSTCTMQRFSHVKINIKKPKDERASPRAIQWLLKLAADEQWFSDCLPVYYEEPTYYSVYKAVEAIRHYCGGEVAMRKRTDLDGSKLVRVKTVADYHRHVQKPTRERPNPFYSLDECVGAVSEALGVLVNDALTRRGFHEPPQ